MESGGVLKKLKPKKQQKTKQMPWWVKEAAITL